jgi:hypothetical protein
MKAIGSPLMGLGAFGVGIALLTSSPASAETLCVRGPVYIEAGIIVPPSDIVKRDVESFMDCPIGSNSYVQNSERQELTSSEIRRIRDAKKEAEEKGEDRK